MHSPRKIEVYIDQLVLHGFATSERYRIGEAIERELTRLFENYGVPQSLNPGSDIPRLDGGQFELTQSYEPNSVGNQVANQVYQGVSNRRSPS